jgi:hypothetical protein
VKYRSLIAAAVVVACALGVLFSGFARPDRLPEQASPNAVAHVYAVPDYAVPDGGTTLMLLGFGLLSLVALKRITYRV